MNFPISDPQEVKELQQRLADLGFDADVDGAIGPQTRAAIRSFQSRSNLVVDGIAGPLTWARLVDETNPKPVICAGFDTAFYPGDAAMQAWKASSPYRFVGYYLKAPVHPNASWMGKRQALVNMGWDLVVIYVGRQVQGPGSSIPPDAASGKLHGADALAKTQAEGFPAATVVYLDVEPMDHIPAKMIDYINSWIGEFSGSHYRIGIYCHKRNAVELSTKITPAAAGVLYWVSGSGAGFQPGASSPTDSGIGFATMWQGSFNQQKTFGGVTIQIDENTAFVTGTSSTFAATNIT